MSDALTQEAEKSGEKKALVFDIQRFCLHDGPGIRTTLFFKGCALRCAWCHNPESHQARQEVAFFAHCCVQCYACREVCPKTAILIGPDQRIDHSLCDSCGNCMASCLTRALSMIGTTWGTADLLAEVRKDRDFFISSGGGITLSGGEPMLQAAFLEGFLPSLKGDGIHVTLETCGYFPWADMERIFDPAIRAIVVAAHSLGNVDNETRSDLVKAAKMDKLVVDVSRTLIGQTNENYEASLLGANQNPDELHGTGKRIIAAHKLNRTMARALATRALLEGRDQHQTQALFSAYAKSRKMI